MGNCFCMLRSTLGTSKCCFQDLCDICIDKDVLITVFLVPHEAKNNGIELCLS